MDVIYMSNLLLEQQAARLVPFAVGWKWTCWMSPCKHLTYREFTVKDHDGKRVSVSPTFAWDVNEDHFTKAMSIARDFVEVDNAAGRPSIWADKLHALVDAARDALLQLYELCPRAERKPEIDDLLDEIDKLGESEVRRE